MRTTNRIVVVLAAVAGLVFSGAAAVAPTPDSMGYNSECTDSMGYNCTGGASTDSMGYN